MRALHLLCGLALMPAQFAVADVTWDVLYGALSDPGYKVNRIGTDGTTLFVVFDQEWEREGKFFRYDFDPNDPSYGLWTQLSDPPRPITVPWAGGVTGKLAYQDGYFYTIGASQNHPYGGDWRRCVLRYDTNSDTWEVLEDPMNPGYDLTDMNHTGNALHMDPANPGVGVGVWHAGDWWVQFDWNAQTYDNNYMNTWYNLGFQGVSAPRWISRNEDLATDGNGRYYATHNDWEPGVSSGEIIYTWTGVGKDNAVDKLVDKPYDWQCGYGQSIEYIPAELSPSGHAELWLIRGSTGDVSHEGWGDPTDDWARLNLTTLQWTVGKLPGDVHYTGRIVRVNDVVFIRGVDDLWYYTKLQGATTASLSGNVNLTFLADPTGRTATLQFRQPGTQTVLHSYGITLDGSGNYSVPSVAQGTFDLALKFPGFLRQVSANKVIILGTNVANFTQTNGDPDGDNLIGLSDLNMILLQFGTGNLATDLNGDGVVGLSDLNIVLLNFGKQGDP
ncbi:MAG: hypothetical protein AMXMBFR61_07320 [Fimbriimonadales bacterium]